MNTYEENALKEAITEIKNELFDLIGIEHYIAVKLCNEQVAYKIIGEIYYRGSCSAPPIIFLCIYIL